MGSNAANIIEISPVSFNDVDLFSEWEIGLGWDIESIQLSAGNNRVSFDNFALPELLVGHFTSKQSMQNVFSVPDGMLVFLITRAKLPLFWNGRNLPPSLMGIGRAGIEHTVVLPSGWDCYEFMVAEEFVWRTELFPMHFYARTSILERAYLPLTEPVTTMFLQQLDILYQQQRGRVTSTHVAVEEGQLIDFIVNGLMQVVDAGLSTSYSLKPKRTRRPDLVKKAREFIAAHLDAGFSVDDVTRSLGVSNRVLNYAFKDALGISPKQYIQAERLHAVRRQLITTDHSVIDACQQYGFNTPSRFARQYSRLFGELPSDTKSQNRG